MGKSQKCACPTCSNEETVARVGHNGIGPNITRRYVTATIKEAAGLGNQAIFNQKFRAIH